MCLVDFICLALGVLNGAFLAIMPKMTEPRPSLFKLFTLGTVLAAAILFLAVSAETATFMTTAVSTLVLGLGTFAICKPLCAAASNTAMPAIQPGTQRLVN